MRLSEAILLGSTTCEMKPGEWNTCALGAAANAVGMPREFEAVLFGDQTTVFSREPALLKRWPWLAEPTGTRNIIVDDETGDEFPERFMDAIYLKFDNDVCEGRMTLEQLIDYVRSVEPDEPVQKMDAVEEMVVAHV